MGPTSREARASREPPNQLRCIVLCRLHGASGPLWASDLQTGPTSAAEGVAKRAGYVWGLSQGQSLPYIEYRSGCQLRRSTMAVNIGGPICRSTPAINSAATQVLFVRTPGGYASVTGRVDRQTRPPQLTATMSRFGPLFCSVPQQAPKSEGRVSSRRATPGKDNFRPVPSRTKTHGAPTIQHLISTPGCTQVDCVVGHRPAYPQKLPHGCDKQQATAAHLGRSSRPKFVLYDWG